MADPKRLGARSGRAVAWLFIVAVMACTTSMSPSPRGSAGASPMPSVAVTNSEAETSCKDARAHESDAFYTPTDVSFHDPVQQGWPIGTPADVGLDEHLLAAAADNAALSPVVQSLLVVRHGKLVFERYFNGSDAGEANNVASVSKSILSLVTGIAIEDGLLALDSRNGKLLWNYQLGATMHGTSPITYMLDGRQHVLVPAGTTLTAWALPQ